MKWISSLAAFVVFSLSCWVATVSESATIERYNDPTMGCTILLSGIIVEGDAQRLTVLIEELRRENRQIYRICFNSPGGSFVEGVRLAQTIGELFGIGSAIANGHICESACAVAYMAGGYTEGGYFGSVRPIMHPQSRLGFHAPNIEIPAGQYTEMQVALAWNVALRAVAEIVEMRASNYDFPERLFFEMLTTPPESMFYIDTVERAARFNISVYPVGLNSLSPLDALKNLCVFAVFQVYTTTANPSDLHGQLLFAPMIRSSAPNRVEAFFEEGFGDEGWGSCRAVLNLNEMNDINSYFSSQIRPVFIEFFGDESGGGQYATEAYAYPYMTFDGAMRLENLPVDIEGTWREFLTRVQVSEPSVQQCWLTSPTARISNVTEYVNLRREPDFSAPIIRQVPLREQVRVLTPENNMVIGQQRDLQSCINACQALGANADDRVARDRAQQCIQDNMIWYEVTDAHNNRGWVSRRYLEEVQ